MASTTLTRRLSGVVVIALLVVWLIMVIASYVGNDWQEQSFRPSPARLAAIADAIENTDGAARQRLIAALSTPVLDIRVAPATDDPPEADLPRKASEEIARYYAPALEGRAFTVSRFALPVNDTDIVHLGRRQKEGIEFRIGLLTGETLIIGNVSPIIATAFGLPIGLGAGLIGTIVALTALVTLYREIRPLSELARAVDRIDLENDPVPLPDIRRQSAEIKALVSAFNRLQARLSRLMRARLAMVAGISHDVRTFATRLRLRVDAIPDPDKRERAVRDITDMIQMLDDALLAAKVGAGDLSEELIDLGQFVAHEVDDRRSAGVPVSLKDMPPAGRAMVLGDPLALRRVVGNLIENAVKYGEVARVSVAIEGPAIVMIFEDDGPGMPVGMADLLTEPFVRGEGSRSRDTGGAGLGLAIVKSLVEAHGGRLAMENSTRRGARIILRLPLYM